MKKTLIALAALAATASFAQVTISGRASLGVASISATGATAGAASDFGSRTVTEDYSSRLRFAVNEDLGGGLRAFAAYEFGLAFDTGTQNAQNGLAPAAGAVGTANGNTSIGFGGSRESHMGIGNNLAEVRIGRQNVYWTQGDLSEQGANKIGKDAIGDMYTRIANVRQNNTILVNLNGGAGAFAGSQVYWAPEVANETQIAGAGTGSANASTYGFKLNYDQGAIHFMADYQKRSSIAGDVPATNPATNTVFDATSTKLGLGYRYAEGSMVGAHYFDMKKEFTDGVTNGTKQTGWAVNLTHNLGNDWYGYGAYGSLSNVNGTVGADTVDSATTAWSVGARKELSKRTALFASYGKVTNGAGANYSPTGGGFMPFAAANGSSPTFTLVGMMHNF